jgi:hypothetical protein
VADYRHPDSVTGIAAMHLFRDNPASVIVRQYKPLIACQAFSHRNKIKQTTDASVEGRLEIETLRISDEGNGLEERGIPPSYWIF